MRIETLDQQAAGRAGLRGVLLRIGRADAGSALAPVTISVGYSSFRNAYGGDWTSRLRLLSVPECALTDPGSAACHPTAVRSTNDLAAGQLTGQVLAGAPVTAAAAPAAQGAATQNAAASGALYALAAGSSGAAGDFGATTLAPSATWQGGGATGDFSWSYPMRSPPAPGGPAPQLLLSYSSGVVDGGTAASNNQPSWAGEGFDLWPGHVERRYKACADDMGGSANNSTKTGDMCWGTDNAVLSLGGSASELVRDDATGGWRPRNDDGSRVERFTGGPNGDNDGEYWRVTTVNGTQYWFGLNRLPGWAAGRPETASTWTVPVYGNNPGEPCHQAAFDASWCQQAWRWNLDYVVDPHGNSMSYWYTAEGGHYGRNLDPAKVSDYTRGGTLARIEYGTRTDAEFGTAPARVLFDVADRCAPGTSCDSAHPASWPDTPWDQDCAASPCTDKYTPTFWTSKRLARVSTQVWGGSAYRDVDSWTLRHSYPDPGDGTRAGLWLDGITHTGLLGSSAALPELTFTGIQMSNRVDTIDHSPPMNWWRVAAIRNETGGETSVRYSDRDCVAGSRMPAAPDANVLRCFPVYWTPQGFTQPVLDWFHKYVVLAVSETDLTGGSPRVATTYEYMGDPVWHYDDDDGLVPPARKSWAQWRATSEFACIAAIQASRRSPCPSTSAVWTATGWPPADAGPSRAPPRTGSPGTTPTRWLAPRTSRSSTTGPAAPWSPARSASPGSPRPRPPGPSTRRLSTPGTRARRPPVPAARSTAAEVGARPARSTPTTPTGWWSPRMTSVTRQRRSTTSACATPTRGTPLPG